MEERRKADGNISIHSLRMEGDHFGSSGKYVPGNFNPLPPYGGRQQLAVHDAQSLVISIHSLRMEGDIGKTTTNATMSDFNPLPPYGGRPIDSNVSIGHRNFNPLPPYGGRLVTLMRRTVKYAFQSTPSVWRETSFASFSSSSTAYFNPLPPYGGRLCQRTLYAFRLCISIHSLRMEGDGTGKSTSLRNFISIHSLRMEGDPPLSSELYEQSNFNPLPPYGGRRTQS